MDWTEVWCSELWVSFLQISPSYEVARQIRAGVLPAGAAVPADIDRVLEVYDDFGDVQDRDPDELTDARYQFMGHFGKRPQTAQMGVVSLGGEMKQAAAIAEGLEAYTGHQWAIEGKPSTVIAAIPLGMPRSEIIKQIEAMLDRLPPDSHLADIGSLGSAPKYQIADKRNDLSSVARYLKAIDVKSRRPSLKNWQIGVIAKLSTVYSDQKARKKQPNYNQTADHIALKELSSRALSRGHMIAENAARGLFPVYKRCEHALPIDWGVLHQRWWENYREYVATWDADYSPVEQRLFWNDVG